MRYLDIECNVAVVFDPSVIILEVNFYRVARVPAMENCEMALCCDVSNVTHVCKKGYRGYGGSSFLPFGLEDHSYM